MKVKDSFLKTKIYNHFMENGKKHLSEKVFLKCFKMLQKQTIKNHKSLTKLSIINTAPVIQIKQIKKKKRKTIKEFPYVLNKKNRVTLSIKSLLSSTKKKSLLKIQSQFVSELLLNSQNMSDLLVSKKSNYKQALSKKKYSFFRWFH